MAPTRPSRIRTSRARRLRPARRRLRPRLPRLRPRRPPPRRPRLRPLRLSAEPAAAEAEPAEAPAAKAEAEAERPRRPLRRPSPSPPRSRPPRPRPRRPPSRPPPRSRPARPPPPSRPAARPPSRPRARQGRASSKVRAEKREPAEARHGNHGVATVVDASGKQVEERELNDALFAVPADVNTLHLVVRAEQAARRRGTASTKTRGEVSGSTAKLYRQKGTGRARAGSVKSPMRTGGGVAFGPHPRSFEYQGQSQGRAQGAGHGAEQPRRERQRRSWPAVSSSTSPARQAMNDFLVKLDIAAPVLVVTHDEPRVAKSVRNLRVRRGRPRWARSPPSRCFEPARSSSPRRRSPP